MSGIVAQNVGRPSGLIKAAAAAAGGGTWVEIKSLTASGDGDLSFVDGTDDVVLDSTYPIYVFKLINIHPSAQQDFQFNMSIDAGSNYNVAKTSSFFRTQQAEDDSGSSLAYQSDKDLAQGTGFQPLGQYLSIGNDSSSSGTLILFNPSSTTFVKHFICTLNSVYDSTYNREQFIAGYGNTTSAVDAIQFKMSSGNIDAGKIKLYGIGDS